MIYNELYLRIDRAINEYLSSLTDIPEPLLSAIKYSVIGGGKRLRPVMTFIGASLGNIDNDDTMKFAIAIELIHCYSLVHDDLPCIDNDTLRRGKPTTHIKYGEAIALLTGDALLNLAYELLTQLSIKRTEYSRAAHYIAKQAGSYGMIGGQCIDIKASKDIEIEEIIRMYNFKTSCLFKAALVGGAIAANSDNIAISLLEEYAESLGIAYQIADDILDVTSTNEVLGKNVKSDIDKNKPTFLSKVGIEEGIKYKNYYESKSYQVIRDLPIKEELTLILDMLINRKN